MWQFCYLSASRHSEYAWLHLPGDDVWSMSLSKPLRAFKTPLQTKNPNNSAKSLCHNAGHSVSHPTYHLFVTLITKFQLLPVLNFWVISNARLLHDTFSNTALCYYCCCCCLCSATNNTLKTLM